MKEFSRNLNGMANGRKTEEEIKNYSKQMDLSLSYFLLFKGIIYWSYTKNAVPIYFSIKANI